MARLTARFSGPFFERDPDKTLAQNIDKMMDALAIEGELDVKSQLRMGESGRYRLGGGVVPGRVSAHVIGRARSLVGKDWRTTAVISIRNQGMTQKQAIKLMAAASWLESQTHAFRRTGGRIRRSGAAIHANLTKGLE